MYVRSAGTEHCPLSSVPSLMLCALGHVATAAGDPYETLHGLKVAAAPRSLA
jgi:hypothetical protein